MLECHCHLTFDIGGKPCIICVILFEITKYMVYSRQQIFPHNIYTSLGLLSGFKHGINSDI